MEAAAGRGPVVIGVHANNRFEAAAYARHAEKSGADAMLALSQTDESTAPQILTEYFTVPSGRQFRPELSHRGRTIPRHPPNQRVLWR